MLLIAIGYQHLVEILLVYYHFPLVIIIYANIARML